MWLVFANRHEEDILLREELDALAAQHPVGSPGRLLFTLAKQQNRLDYSVCSNTDSACGGRFRPEYQLSGGHSHPYSHRASRVVCATWRRPYVRQQPTGRPRTHVMSFTLCNASL